MKLRKRIVLVILYLLLLSVLIEWVTKIFFQITRKDIDYYRNFSDNRTPKIFIQDPMLGYKMLPNVTRNALTHDFQIVYRTNSMGLREKELGETGKYKIIFLGDSMTFGEGVDIGMRFSDIIEKEIENVYTVNAGVPGYGIHQMYLWLKDYGLGLKPDLVICTIIPIDLERAIYNKLARSPHLRGQNKRLSPAPESRFRRSMRRFDRWVTDNSYFYPFAKSRARVFSLKSQLKERDKQTWAEITRKGERGRFKITTDEQRRMVKEEASRIFLQFKSLTDEAGVKFIVVNFGLEAVPWLYEFLRENGIAYLDISQRIKKTPNIRFEIDGHYNVAGNRVIADLLKDHIWELHKDDILKKKWPRR